MNHISVDDEPEWVPVEHRVAGLDRRSIRWAVVPLLVVLLAAYGLPALAGALEWDDPVEPGDVLQAGNGITFEPAVGWGVESGLRVGGAETAVHGGDPLVTRGGVSFAVTTAPWDTDAQALLDQITETTDALNDESDFHVSGAPQEFTTTAGDTGLMARYLAPSSQGLLAAVVVDGVGVQVTVTGPEDDVDEDIGVDVARMLVSIDHGGQS